MHPHLVQYLWIFGSAGAAYILSQAFLYYWHRRFLPPSELLDVAFVADGDTLHLESPSNGKTYKVRLIGIDAPESHHSEKLERDAKERGVSAKQIMAAGRTSERLCRRWVQGCQVSLQYDPRNKHQSHRGKYGRLLAYVWVHRGSEVIMLNRIALQVGWAEATSYPHARLQEFQQLARQAKTQRDRSRPQPGNRTKGFSQERVGARKRPHSQLNQPR